ncbi:DUF6491 family protein [Sphingomonas profundi]|uniref:DUF6491 family protein n=1 Tax=Alterirhizorhabdus profundi TaxID=2681549 RepID=UPI0012E8012F|nr:DUF6491 family protein [Sphingomonas profundi]
MRRALFALALLAVALPAAAPAASVLSDKAQAALKGRTAGAPVDCISLPRIRSSTIVDGTAIIYKEGNHRWYVNVPDPACPMLESRRSLITRIPSTRLCRLDLVTVVDLPIGFDYGACALGSFVPYTR